MRVLVRGEPVMELDRRPWESVEKASEVGIEKWMRKWGWAWPGHLDPLFGSVWVEGWALGPFRRDLCPFRSKPLF